MEERPRPWAAPETSDYTCRIVTGQEVIMKARSSTILPAAVALLAVLSPLRLHAGVGEWTSKGPDGGIVDTLAVHPNNPSTVYASSAGVLYKSVDAGATWAATGLRQFTNLVVPTSDPAVMYTTTILLFSTESSLLYRTNDGGETWAERPGPRGSIAALVQDGSDPMALYAATSSGIFRSGNGGDSWEAVPNPVAGFVIAVAGVAVDPSDSRVIYAAVQVGGTGGATAGVYRSSDRGQTWTRTSVHESVESIIAHPEDASVTLFAVTADNGLQVSTDGGLSWQRRAAGMDISLLAVDPGGASHLYLVALGAVLKSSDGGQTVTPVLNGNFGQGVRGIAFSTFATVLVGSEKGISRSEDSGATWRTTNVGIRGVFVESVAVDPTDPDVVFAAGGRGLFESRNGGDTWNGPTPLVPDTQSVAIDPTDRSTVYAAGAGGVYKSSDGGQTWNKKGPPSSVLADQISELLIDPNNPRRLFAAYLHVYQSADGADTWRNLLTPDDNYSTYYGGPPTVNAIALAPSDSAVIYAGGDGGFVYRSVDGGESWSDLRAGIIPYALAVDSCDPGIVQAGGFNAVYRNVDGGATWQASPVPWDSDFPYGFVNALAHDPRHSSSVFAGTSQGVFWTNDRGKTWKRFEPRLDESVRSLALDPTGRFLYAGTDRGVFELERTFEPCGNGPDRLCLLGAKYQVSLTARDPRTGASITGRAFEEGDRFGYFSLPGLTGDPSFPEVFVKMKDATGAPPPYGGHAWVFHSSLTDLDYKLTVLETDTGRIQIYEAADSESLTCGRADTSAFERDCTAEVSASQLPPAPTGASSDAGADLSLLGGRFRATVQARDPRTGRIAVGTAIPRGDQFGYFSLPDFTGDPSFPEIFVKMADATSQPGSYFWVFHTGLTDLEYTLTVTDQQTGAVRTYQGGATNGTQLCGQADTSAFRD